MANSKTFWGVHTDASVGAVLQRHRREAVVEVTARCGNEAVAVG